jgi:hypothetical protein
MNIDRCILEIVSSCALVFFHLRVVQHVIFQVRKPSVVRFASQRVTLTDTGIFSQNILLYGLHHAEFECSPLPLTVDKFYNLLPTTHQIIAQGLKICEFFPHRCSTATLPAPNSLLGNIINFSDSHGFCMGYDEPCLS